MQNSLLCPNPLYAPLPPVPGGTPKAGCATAPSASPAGATQLWTHGRTAARIRSPPRHHPSPRAPRSPPFPAPSPPPRPPPSRPPPRPVIHTAPPLYNAAGPRRRLTANRSRSVPAASRPAAAARPGPARPCRSGWRSACSSSAASPAATPLTVRALGAGGTGQPRPTGADAPRPVPSRPAGRCLGRGRGRPRVPAPLPARPPLWSHPSRARRCWLRAGAELGPGAGLRCRFGGLLDPLHPVRLCQRRCGARQRAASVRLGGATPLTQR